MAERLKQALERARAEREASLRSGDVRATPILKPSAEFTVTRHEAPVLPATGRSGTLEPPGRELPVDSDHLRRERILPPYMNVAPGKHGASAVQAYKMLRTQVLQRMESNRWNTLAVMSPTPGDGKTLTAINLAIAIAADSGRSAILVDFDLRRPTVAARFGFQPGEFVGVEEALAGGRPLEEVCVRAQGYDRLFILNSSAPVTASSELLSSAGTRRLMSELKSTGHNRMIIVDLPPLLESDDALAFAPQVDAVLLVLGSNHTHSADVLRSFELLRDKPVIGTLLNRSRAKTASDHPY